LVSFDINIFSLSKKIKMGPVIIFSSLVGLQKQRGGLLALSLALRLVMCLYGSL
jgi:hypothetical protein